MALPDQWPLGEERDRLTDVVERVEREHGRVVITRGGRPTAVVLSVEELESLEETLTVLSDPGLVELLGRSAADIGSGAVAPLTKEEALGELRRG